MKLQIPLKVYKRELAKQLNEPLQLSAVLQPFGLDYWSHSSSQLFIGHLLDTLSEHYQDDELIDPFAVMEFADFLGHEEAESLLTYLPQLLLQVAVHDE